MKSTVSEHSQGVDLRLSGKIDEKSIFPPLQNMNTSRLIVDFADVTTINSLGIQNWIDFLTTLRQPMQIVFANCPPCVVLQINMLENFMPQGGEIKSVLVPFYCNSCDREFTEKYHVGTDVELKGGNILLNKNSSTLCKDDSCDIETDINRDKFFHFLKRGTTKV